MKNTPLEKTLYHSLLRISVCVMAVVLVFHSGLLSKTTANLSISTQQYLASAVGVQVGVGPTEVNILTARITELERDLEVSERQIAVNLSTESNPPAEDKSTFVLSTILFILLLLIILNYALDYIRVQDEKLGYNARDHAPV